MSRRFVQAGVTAAALGLAVMGAALLFAPAEAARALGWVSQDTPLELLGGALLGLAAMNWIARGSMLGGIYGRSVVTADQIHFTVGALLLGKNGLAFGGPPAFWLAVLFFVAGAGFFNLVLLRGGLPKQ